MLIGLISARSQDTVTYPYRITGTIYDNHGNPFPGVNILSAGDGNRQISDLEGKYYAYIYNQNTAVVFSYYKFVSVQHCPDGRIEVDIVLAPEKGWWFKKMTRRIGSLFRSKKNNKASISC